MLQSVFQPVCVCVYLRVHGLDGIVHKKTHEVTGPTKDERGHEVLYVPDFFKLLVLN